MRRAVHTGTRVFDKRTYYFYEHFRLKSDAIKRAKARREMGYLVRMIRLPFLDGYFLYERAERLSRR